MVKYKIESDEGKTVKGKADLVLTTAFNGNKMKTCVIGDGDTADMVKGLSIMIAELANVTGKGFEFVQLVSAGATLVLMENGGGDKE